MKRLLYGLAFGVPLVALVLLAWLVVSKVRGHATRAANQQQIITILMAQQNAWNDGDIRLFMQGYWNSPELTFAGSKGFTRGWQPVLERYEKTYAGMEAMGKLDFSELEIRPLSPDAALVLGRWHLERKAGDVGGIFSLVLKKFPEGWRIIHDHTAQTPPEAK